MSMDAELERRLDAYAVANAHLRGGMERDRLRAEVESSFMTERVPEPLPAGTVVMGTRLARTDIAYGSPTSGTWVLLKCDAPGPFFFAFDMATGAADMFPRRFDANGYAFALQLLRVVA